MSTSEHNTERITGEALQHLLTMRSEFIAFLEKRVGSRATAEDLLQSAFVRTIDRADVPDEENVVAWFYRVLRNAVVDHYRRSASSARAMDSFARELQDAHVAPPDLHDEICRCVIDAMEELKPEYREALKAVDIDEKPVADIAASAGISSNNATVRLHRARQALRKQVMLTCGVCATHGCVDCRCKKGCDPQASKKPDAQV